ncbi:MAG: hypothetical protein ABIE68_04260 [bacterium]
MRCYTWSEGSVSAGTIMKRFRSGNAIVVGENNGRGSKFQYVYLGYNNPPEIRRNGKIYYAHPVPKKINRNGDRRNGNGVHYYLAKPNNNGDGSMLVYLDLKKGGRPGCLPSFESVPGTGKTEIVIYGKGKISTTKGWLVWKQFLLVMKPGATITIMVGGFAYNLCNIPREGLISQAALRAV